jgi:hypothetical protein
MKIKYLSLLAALIIGCSPQPKKGNNQEKNTMEQTNNESEIVKARPEIYAKVKLTTDISILSENEKKMLGLLIEAAQEMDKVFWKQSFPQYESYNTSGLSEAEKLFYQINYGPWDRLNGNKPFIKGIGEKPLGAGYYPVDMTKEEFEAWEAENKKSLYNLVKRDEKGNLILVPFYEAYKENHLRASELLKKASKLAETDDLKKFLNLRADALLTDDYDESDIAWLDMTENTLDIIIGPIENYEDKLFGYKATHEAYVLVKDKAWSERLAKYVAYLTELQENLPVEDIYKAEKPGTDAQLNAYDVVYYAGDCNAGSKTIAVNLPNDEEIQKSKGTRRSQLKNAMQAKFDQILVPIANELIIEEQRKNITFEAFFGNTMFHEVAHGLGIKNTINGKGTAREALKEKYSALEEGKADILGLYMVSYLSEIGVYTEGELLDNYVTFLAGIFRSVRFGAASAHGKANMLRFNYFEKEGAFSKDQTTGLYKVEFEKMKLAMNKLSAFILKLQGDGDYEGVEKVMEEMGSIGPKLQKDLDGLSQKGIPVDIIFDQGKAALGL